MAGTLIWMQGAPGGRRANIPSGAGALQAAQGKDGCIWSFSHTGLSNAMKYNTERTWTLIC